MMPFCYGGGSEREQFVTQLVSGMQQCTPAEARRRIMIGSKDECQAPQENPRGGVDCRQEKLPMPLLVFVLALAALMLVASLR